MFTGTGIDMNAIAGNPGEYLWFCLHRLKLAATTKSCKLFVFSKDLIRRNFELECPSAISYEIPVQPLSVCIRITPGLP